MEMLSAIKEVSPKTQVIIITGYSDVKMAVKTIKHGAYDYIEKPLYHEQILSTIKQAQTRNHQPEKQDNGESQNIAKSDYIIGKSHDSLEFEEHLQLVAPTHLTCYLVGESGTGKEYVARRIHEHSERTDAPFVAVDCGALPNDIATSELFGHEKGAFTGALKPKKGFFELADGGTLFLDEVGNLNPQNQMKLLRVLQEGSIRRIGDHKTRNVDIRLIVATNENLEKLVEDGRFRADLYHRINEFKLELKPLRERAEDFPLFAEHLLAIASQSLQKSVDSIEPQAMDILAKQSWPGNLRELGNVLKRAVLLEKTAVLHKSSLPEFSAQTFKPHDVTIKDDSQTGYDLKAASEEAEKMVIKNALEATNSNKSQAAQLLEIDRKTLYNKMGQYGITDLKDELEKAGIAPNK